MLCQSLEGGSLDREHPVHPAHFQAHSVDTLRHQESLWREERPAEWRKPAGEEDHRAPITEEVEEFREIGTAPLPDSKISEMSHFQSQMHFDDSVESIADSDLEDGELQKMLTYFTTVCPESFGETRCNGRAGERGKCTIHSSRPKAKFEVSFV